MSELGFLRPYSLAERWADFVIHVLGVSFAVIGGTIAIVLAVLDRGTPVIAATAVYVASLFATLLVSALYNSAPPGDPRKAFLQRLDHATIFTLIAGSATPFAGPEASLWLFAIWAFALASAAARLFRAPLPEPVFISLYLILGWAAGGLVLASFSLMPLAALILIIVGGGLYTVGVAFHVWESLKFHNAIWHGFVLSAAACHYAAILVGAVIP